MNLKSIKFHIRPLQRFSKKTQTRFKELTNFGPSQMRDALLNIRPTHIAISAKHEEKVIAWGLITIRATDVLIQVYVESYYRRQGIGTAIVARAIDYAKSRKISHIAVRPWSVQSDKFFSSMGIKGNGSELKKRIINTGDQNDQKEKAEESYHGFNITK